MQKLDRHAAGSLVLVDEAAEQVAAGSRDGLRRPARVRASGLLRTAHAPWTQEGHGSEPWPSRESDEGPALRRVVRLDRRDERIEREGRLRGDPLTDRLLFGLLRRGRSDDVLGRARARAVEHRLEDDDVHGAHALAAADLEQGRESAAAR